MNVCFNLQCYSVAVLFMLQCLDFTWCVICFILACFCYVMNCHGLYFPQHLRPQTFPPSYSLTPQAIGRLLIGGL